jgi:hypothetical protein
VETAPSTVTAINGFRDSGVSNEYVMVIISYRHLCATRMRCVKRQNKHLKVISQFLSFSRVHFERLGIQGARIKV